MTDPTPSSADVIEGMREALARVICRRLKIDPDDIISDGGDLAWQLVAHEDIDPIFESYAVDPEELEKARGALSDVYSDMLFQVGPSPWTMRKVAEFLGEKFVEPNYRSHLDARIEEQVTEIKRLRAHVADIHNRIRHELSAEIEAATDKAFKAMSGITALALPDSKPDQGGRVMPGELRMTKEEMRVGLIAGRRLTQEEWAHPDEIRFVEELVSEGVAHVTAWEYRDGFQCEMRRVSKAEGKPHDH